MAEVPLSKAQEAFLEECALEFSDRFTDADLDFKKIYDSGVPKPPIMSPWFGRGRFNNWGRDREGGGRFNDRRERYNNDNHHRDSRDRDHGRDSYHQRRFRPY